MITVPEFMKLLALQEQGCQVYYDGASVTLYRSEPTTDPGLTAEEADRYACTFSFVGGSGGVYTLLNDAAADPWTVRRCVEVDWRNIQLPETDATAL